MYIGKPINEREVDLLLGREHESLIFKDDEDCIINTFKSPRCGWSHALIERVYSYFGTNLYYCCYDIYLGDKWVGSSEV
ncbi:hypothetical protein [Moritella viscosa]|uniref:hypothetical protein n=1 Tax=Moritella viscosa TaxID=80854 RepID=UPI000917AE15|nr:hypothetical protein [Moritella viscosa]SGZ09442.1 Putative uncharacterized protein [Moritella viscosa]